MVISYFGCPNHCTDPLLLPGTLLLRSYCAGYNMFLLLSWREMDRCHSPRVTSNRQRCRSSCSDFRFVHKDEGSSRWIYVLFTWSLRAALFPDRLCRLRVQGWVRLDIFLPTVSFFAFSLPLMFSLVLYSDLLEQVVLCWKRGKINSHRVLKLPTTRHLPPLFTRLGAHSKAVP
jgi:hypothetical protein